MKLRLGNTRDGRAARGSLLAALLLLTLLLFPAVMAGGPIDPWKQTDLVSPEALARQLSNSKTAKPRLICVGFRFLYDQAHLPGAEYCGPAREPAGLKKLRDCVKSLPRNSKIILYCGCCPWQECPNIRPASELLKQLGFTQVKVLEIPQNFGHDWVQKGYPVEKTR